MQAAGGGSMLWQECQAGGNTVQDFTDAPIGTVEETLAGLPFKVACSVWMKLNLKSPHVNLSLFLC